MDSKYFIKLILISPLLITLLLGCWTKVYFSIEPPPFPDTFMSAKWGASAEEAKQAIHKDGNKWFKESTDKPPYAIYASGDYLDEPAIFSYFFTPKSKRLYRVDVTFSNLRVYEKGRNDLIQKFKKPSFSQKDVDHWSWNDKSLIILQEDSTHVQISYSNGPLLVLNQKERGY